MYIIYNIISSYSKFNNGFHKHGLVMSLLQVYRASSNVSCRKHGSYSLCPNIYPYFPFTYYLAYNFRFKCWKTTKQLRRS